MGHCSAATLFSPGFQLCRCSDPQQVCNSVTPGTGARRSCFSAHCLASGLQSAGHLKSHLPCGLLHTRWALRCAIYRKLSGGDDSDKAHSECNHPLSCRGPLRHFARPLVRSYPCSRARTLTTSILFRTTSPVANGPRRTWTLHPKSEQSDIMYIHICACAHI